MIRSDDTPADAWLAAVMHDAAAMRRLLLSRRRTAAPPSPPSSKSLAESEQSGADQHSQKLLGGSDHENEISGTATW